MTQKSLALCRRFLKRQQLYYPIFLLPYFSYDQTNMIISYLKLKLYIIGKNQNLNLKKKHQTQLNLTIDISKKR